MGMPWMAAGDSMGDIAGCDGRRLRVPPAGAGGGMGWRREWHPLVSGVPWAAAADGMGWLTGCHPSAHWVPWTGSRDGMGGGMGWNAQR